VQVKADLQKLIRQKKLSRFFFTKCEKKIKGKIATKEGAETEVLG
jgi:hypothetical protein